MLRIRIARMALFVAMFMILIPYVHTANASGYNLDVSAYPPTVGIATGMIKFGSSTTAYLPKNPKINWGDGYIIDAKMDCKHNVVGTVTCNYYGHEHVYSSAGPVTTSVTYTNPLTSKTISIQGPRFTVAPIGNFVIVSVGDSVASGEGNPIVDKAPSTSVTPHPAFWDYGDVSDYPRTVGSKYGCHGSSVAGPSLAAQEIKKENSAQVTFIHMACSGARIGTDNSTEEPDYTTGQLIRLKKILAGKKIDALLITSGANSVDNGFQTIIDTCLAYACDDTSSSNTSVQDFQAHMGAANIKGNLDPGYAVLASIIDGGDLNVSDSNVYINQYFDPTHDASGNGFPSPADTNTCTAGRITHSEWSYLYHNLLKPLNEEVSDVAAKYGWHYVDGVAADALPQNTFGSDDFNQHGYCIGFPGVPGTSWVVHGGDSKTNQGDPAGTGHPNLAGHTAYQHRIVAMIYQWTLPVTTATATTAEGSYPFGTWTHGDVAVTLAASNKLVKAGVGKTYYSVDDPACSDADNTPCTVYSAPFSITTPGTHIVYFFSANAPKDGNNNPLPVELEKVNSERVQIDTPSASKGAVTTQQDNAVSGQLNASSPDSGDTLTFSIVGQPSHGTVSIDDANKGTFTYTPANGYIGGDSFTFMVNNGYVDSNTATESVTVADNPPVASDDTADTTSDQAVSGQLKASDPDSGETLTFSIVGQPSHGTVSLDDAQKGAFTYTPDAGYVGNDTFTFDANDGHVDSNTATETIAVASGTSQPSSGGGGGSGGGSGGGGIGPITMLVLLTMSGLRRAARKKGR